MNFRGDRQDEEPEINLIAFIDILLVILIFLMLSTTYSRFTELKVNLPAADAEKLQERPREIIISVASDGRYALDRQPLDGRDVESLAAAMRVAAGGKPDAMVIISADALAVHQSVINVLDAARRAGLARVTFAAQNTAGTR
ncbi:MAG: biopolymer transporter ExbD [Rubrivivax sp.]|nr:biopolymer transporter ExbD [Rubrivivax sp.]